MTYDLTPEQEAEQRLPDALRRKLDLARSMFLREEINHLELESLLTDEFGFSHEAARGYVDSVCDASDGDPSDRPEEVAPQPAPTPARPASDEPVETRRPILKPAYAPKPPPSSR